MSDKYFIKFERIESETKWFDQFDNLNTLGKVLKNADLASEVSIYTIDKIDLSKRNRIYLLSIKNNKLNKLNTIAVDITNEVPYWEQVEKYIYGQYEDVGKVVIVYGNLDNLLDQSVDFEIEYHTALSLVHVANSCGKNISVIEASPNYYKKGEIESLMYKIDIKRNDIGFEKLPSRKEFIMAQFWNKYHKLRNYDPIGFHSHPEVWFRDPCSADILDMKSKLVCDNGKICLKLSEKPESVAFKAFIEPNKDKINQLYDRNSVAFNKNKNGLRELKIDLGSEAFERYLDNDCDYDKKIDAIQSIVQQEREIIQIIYTIIGINKSLLRFCEI